ncbi:MAG: DUF2461 domain-containing protein, partial [Chitinophagaceae bacterium]|nr:DUF2461 domain-containing protein [Chitinophagaceae bacterium]
MFSKNTIDFLKNIKLNNNRDWMASHQKEYASAKNDFFNMVEKILIEMKKKDQSYESTLTKQCIFRLNRDVRFSKDKSPFKINFGAAIGPQGKKTQGACYYLHLEPGNSFIGGGIWMPTPNELNKILQEIDYNTEDFFKIINEKKFKKTFGDLNKESQLKKVRKGFETNRKAA